MDAPDSLRAAITAQKLTHAKFAKRVGASTTMLSLWLNGHSRPGLDFAVKLQTETGIPVSAWKKMKRAPRRSRVA